MARIAGVNIPTAKRVVIALTYIHGIGPKFAQEIIEKAGIAADRRVHQLTDAEVLQIRETIDRDYQVEGDLPDGRFLLSQGRIALWACDPSTGTWTRLTDLEVDHSTRPEDLLAPVPAEEARNVEEGDGWVEIGDIRLPRR